MDDPIVVVATDQVSCDLAGEAAILNLNSGVFYALDPVGAAIWNLLQKPMALSGLRDALLQEYDVAPERCEGDLRLLVQQLATAGLLEVQAR